MRCAVALVFALVVSFLPPSAASAANTTPEQALPLDVRTPAASDTLVGATGGAYKFYRVPYQGGNAPVSFSLAYSPAWGTGNQLFGFNLYGPSGLTFAGQVTNVNGNTATAEYNLVNGAAMSILVEIYNYSDGGPVSYTLTVSGLSGGSTATIVGKDNTTPDRAAAVTSTNVSIGGSIVGSAAGAYQYYTLHYPGGGSPLSITLNAAPVYPGPGQAIGFNVFRALANGTNSLVAGGPITAQDANSATMTATVNERSAADYQLQVFNYWPGVSVNYGVTVTGLAGPATPASGNETADRAGLLNSARPGATETIHGNQGGAYNFFVVNYPGNNSNIWVSVTFLTTGGAGPGTLGLNVYEGGNQIASAVTLDDGSGVQSATWWRQDPSAKTYGIQVFDYAPGTTASYVIYQVGSQ